MINWPKAISAPLRQIKLRECSLFPRRVEKSKWYKTINILILKPLKNNYPLPLIPELINKIGDAKLFTNKWIFDRDTTMSEFGKEMKEKQPLPVTEALMNL